MENYEVDVLTNCNEIRTPFKPSSAVNKPKPPLSRKPELPKKPPIPKKPPNQQDRVEGRLNKPASPSDSCTKQRSVQTGLADGPQLCVDTDCQPHSSYGSSDRQYCKHIDRLDGIHFGQKNENKTCNFQKKQLSQITGNEKQIAWVAKSHQNITHSHSVEKKTETDLLYSCLSEQSVKSENKTASHLNGSCRIESENPGISNYLDLLSERTSGCGNYTDFNHTFHSADLGHEKDHNISGEKIENSDDHIHHIHHVDGEPYHISELNLESNSCSNGQVNSLLETIDILEESKKVEYVDDWRERDKSYDGMSHHIIRSTDMKHTAENFSENLVDLEGSPVIMREKPLKPIPKKRLSLGKHFVNDIFEHSNTCVLKNYQSQHESTVQFKNMKQISAVDPQSVLTSSSVLDDLEEMVHQSLVEIEKIDTDGQTQENLSWSSKYGVSDPIRPPRPKRLSVLAEEDARSRLKAVDVDIGKGLDFLVDQQSKQEYYNRRSDSFDEAIQDGEISLPLISTRKKIPPKPKRNIRSRSDVTGMKPQVSLDPEENSNQPPPLPDRIHSKMLKALYNAENLPDKNVISDESICTDEKSSMNVKVGRSHSAGVADCVKPPRKPPPTRKPPPLPDNMTDSCESSPNAESKHTKIYIVHGHKKKATLCIRHRASDRPYIIVTDKGTKQTGNTVDSDSDPDYSEISELVPECEDNDKTPSKHSTSSPPQLPPRNIYSKESNIPVAPPHRKSKEKIISDQFSVDVVPSHCHTDSLKTPRCQQLQERPVSGISIQSGSSQGSPEHDDQSLSEPETEEEKFVITAKREKKIHYKVHEIVSSEEAFVDKLKLLNVDFRFHISQATEEAGKTVIPNEVLNKILEHLPQLQNFNEDLLKDLRNRLTNWSDHMKISDVFVKKGRFLMLYTPYIQNFENTISLYDEALKKFPTFFSAVREFEGTARCASLAVSHYLLKPIQRIPQYKLLLQEYLKLLSPECVDHKDTVEALNIVSRVADHVNESMRQGDTVQKMLEIQQTLVGQFEVVKPGRVFIKKGELMKCSRKEKQPRMFFLFSDVLLYTTPYTTGFRVNTDLPLAGMKVSRSELDDFKNQFSICTVHRSFTVEAETEEQCEKWVSGLTNAIADYSKRKNTFSNAKAGLQSLDNENFILGSEAPVWIPDDRVTMCMVCTSEFSITWRRHHCRACGRVVCGNCSDNKAPLQYLNYDAAKVCDECFDKLKSALDNETVDHAVDESAKDGFSLAMLKERFEKIRKSGRFKSAIVRPSRLKVSGNAQGSSICGYLKVKMGKNKWKKRWFVIKEKVLYTYKATEDAAAIESMPMLGYTIARFNEPLDGVNGNVLFQVSHQNRPPLILRSENAVQTEKWVTMMEEASVT